MNKKNLFLLKDMDQDSAHMVAASKVSMLKPGEYEIWRMRIEQYIQMIDYALWEVIENGTDIKEMDKNKGQSRQNQARDRKEREAKAKVKVNPKKKTDNMILLVILYGVSALISAITLNEDHNDVLRWRKRDGSLGDFSCDDMDWKAIVLKLSNMQNVNNIGSIVRRLCFASCVYLIWQERNRRLFKDEGRNLDDLYKILTDTIKLMLSSLKVKKNATGKILAFSNKWLVPNDSKLFVETFNGKYLVSWCPPGLSIGLRKRSERTVYVEWNKECVVAGWITSHNATHKTGQSSPDKEEEVNSLVFEFFKDAATLLQASLSTTPNILRNSIPRDCHSVHDRLVAAYFAVQPSYTPKQICKRFRMGRKLFTRIVQELSDMCLYFQQTRDAVGKCGNSVLVKCTFAIRQLAYDAVPDSLDEYL
ncbi:hypothetical protein Tco_0534659 [Tanacetum coccineum]